MEKARELFIPIARKDKKDKNNYIAEAKYIHFRLTIGEIVVPDCYLLRLKK